MTLEWTTTETPPTPEPVTVRHELHVKVYRAGANELGAAYERLITSRRATPDDLARLGYVPATPPESKQRVDGFLGAGEPDARIAELEASAARAPGLRDESNGEAGDFTTLCDACYQETDEPHSAKDCVAYRNHVSDQDGRLMREQHEERLSALTAEVERLRGERDELRERYAGLERAARGWLDVVEKEMRAHPCGPRAWSLHDPGLGIRDAISALDSAPAPTDDAQLEQVTAAIAREWASRIEAWALGSCAANVWSAAAALCKELGSNHSAQPADARGANPKPEWRGGFDPDPFGTQKASPPKIPGGSTAPTDASGSTTNYELPWYREGQSVYDAKGDLVAGATSVTDAAFIVARCNTPATTDAAREAAAEILAALVPLFPKCDNCNEPARCIALGMRFCTEHAPSASTSPPWLPALEVAERIAKGSSQ